MSSKQGGAGKISGEEKKLIAQQEQLLGMEQQRLRDLQTQFTALQPQTYNLLGIDPTTGQFRAPGARPAAPIAPTRSHGDRPADYVFRGKNFGKNDRKAQEAVRNAQAAWDAKEADYQRQMQAYNQQKAQYDQQMANFAEYEKNNPAMLQPQVARQQAQTTMNDILAGRVSAVDASRQGQTQAEAAAQAQLLQQITKGLGGETANAGEIGRLRELYNRELSGNTPEAGAMQRFLDQVTRIQTGQDVDAPLLQGFRGQLGTYLRGGEAINPGLERELQNREQQVRARMQKQLGSGWETSSAGIETLGQYARDRAQVIDEQNRLDLQAALSGYTNVGGMRQQNLTNALGGYQGLFNTQQARQGNTFGQLTGFQGIDNALLADQMSQYTGLASDTESRRMQEYQNELSRRTGLADLVSNIQTQPYTGVSFGDIASQYGSMASQARQRQAAQNTGGGGGVGGALGGALMGGLSGAAAGFMTGGPWGAAAGGALGAGMGAYGGSQGQAVAPQAYSSAGQLGGALSGYLSSSRPYSSSMAQQQALNALRMGRTY